MCFSMKAFNSAHSIPPDKQINVSTTSLFFGWCYNNLSSDHLGQHPLCTVLLIIFEQWRARHSFSYSYNKCLWINVTHLLPCPDIKSRTTLEHKSSDLMSFSVYICGICMYPLVASLRTKPLIPHFAGFAFIYCLNDSLLLKEIIASSIVTSLVDVVCIVIETVLSVRLQNVELCKVCHYLGYMHCQPGIRNKKLFKSVSANNISISRGSNIFIAILPKHF